MLLERLPAAAIVPPLLHRRRQPLHLFFILQLLAFAAQLFQVLNSAALCVGRHRHTVKLLGCTHKRLHAAGAKLSCCWMH